MAYCATTRNILNSIPHVISRIAKYIYMTITLLLAKISLIQTKYNFQMEVSQCNYKYSLKLPSSIFIETEVCAIKCCWWLHTKQIFTGRKLPPPLLYTKPAKKQKKKIWHAIITAKMLVSTLKHHILSRHCAKPQSAVSNTYIFPWHFCHLL